ncbi:MAG: hypothetical protein IT192_07400 [Microbacteriaceae bacterium]|nr:hypothetical protein [Microbacteriaceae bacterium]
MHKLKRVSSIVGAVALANAIMLIGVGCAAQPTPSQYSPSGTPHLPYPTSQADGDRMFAECMEARGWEATVNETDGGVSFSVPPEQSEVFQKDAKECQSQIPIRPWVEEDYEQHFQDLTVVATCLQDHGFEVPPRPSLQSFIEDYKKGLPWDPYAITVADGDFPQAVELCPQAPIIF